MGMILFRIVDNSTSKTVLDLLETGYLGLKEA